MNKLNNKYRIPSACLQTWDYGANGLYFVTNCPHNREHYFGEIIDGEMAFPEIGRLANSYWNEIPEHFTFIRLDEFVVMPNHIHGIIIIDKTDGGRPNDVRGLHVETPDSGVSTPPSPYRHTQYPSPPPIPPHTAAASVKRAGYFLSTSI